ncbi:hypothetical protein QBC38DRAFT_486388 [Podospora fimiseda]|uniref:NmrA-like domain-containing protein n=1 Tax=Podospora fimiseda TaxID=252190 RepID=A0AAN7BIQ1_9PEZI|nr:hypothetical protein QBC38DRAFT_486388 [Podospora fimiseda]
MSTPITNIVLAGATGNLGPTILSHLLSANYTVTVLTRHDSPSTHSFPPSVKVLPVNYDSLSSLTSALQNQHAVISTLGSAALTKQLLLIQAASSISTIQKFIPSEFGSDTTNPKVASFPGYDVTKIPVQKALETSGLNWTLIFNGPFLDWAIKVGWLIDLQKKKITLYDGGKREFSSSTLEDIGKAVIGVLKKPEETKNKVVYVESARVTLRELLEKAKKVTETKEEDWNVEDVSVEDLVRKGWEEAKDGKTDQGEWVIKFIVASIFGEGYGGLFDEGKLDNELVGVKRLSEEEVEGIVRRYV